MLATWLLGHTSQERPWTRWKLSVCCERDSPQEETSRELLPQTLLRRMDDSSAADAHHWLRRCRDEDDTVPANRRTEDPSTAGEGHSRIAQGTRMTQCLLWVYCVALCLVISSSQNRHVVLRLHRSLATKQTCKNPLTEGYPTISIPFNFILFAFRKPAIGEINQGLYYLSIKVFALKRHNPVLEPTGKLFAETCRFVCWFKATKVWYSHLNIIELLFFFCCCFFIYYIWIHLLISSWECWWFV